MHVLLWTPSTPWFSIERDLGPPEFYQYTKEAWIAVLLFSVSLKTNVRGYRLWGLLFLFLMFDDAWKIHENLGNFIASGLSFVPVSYLNLRARDFGELASAALTAIVFLPPLILNYVRGSSLYKKRNLPLLLLLGALAFFGVFVDILDRMMELGRIEDGGEMVVMSLIAGYVFWLRETFD